MARIKIPLSHNFNAITLVTNVPIVIRRGDQNIGFHIPTISELYSSGWDYGFFIGVMTMTIAELNKQVRQFEFTSRLECIRYLWHNDAHGRLVLEHFFQIITSSNFKYIEELDILTINNFEVDDQVLDLMSDMLRVGLGAMKLDDFNSIHNSKVQKTPEELEWEAREREMNAKIAALKAQNGENGLSIDKILFLLHYTFGTSLEELGNKNFYTINEMYKYAMCIDAYHINLVAEGNGLVDKKHKHTHWINMK